SLLRHWRLVVIVVVLTGLAVAGYLLNRKVATPVTRYSGSEDILIPARDPKTNEDPKGVPAVLLQGQTELASDPKTKAAALDASKLDPVTRRKITLKATLSEGRDQLTLTVTGPDAQSVTAALNGYATAYANARRQSVLTTATNDKEVLKGTIKSLTGRLVQTPKQLIEQNACPFP